LSSKDNDKDVLLGLIDPIFLVSSISNAYLIDMIYYSDKPGLWYGLVSNLAFDAVRFIIYLLNEYI
jgi:hypothetical protein